MNRKVKPYIKVLNDRKKEIATLMTIMLTSLTIIVFPVNILWLILLLALLSFIIVCKYRFGLYLLVMFVFLETQFFLFTTSWSLKTDILPVFFPLFIVVFLSWMLARMAKLEDGGGNLISDIDFFLFLFLGWSSITLFWTPNFYHGLVQWIRFGTNLMLFYLIANCLNHESYHKKVVGICIFMGVVIAAAGIISLFYDHDYTYIQKITDKIRLNLRFYTYYTRAMGLTAHNAAASILNIIMVLTFASLLASKKWRIKLLLAGAFLIMAVDHLYTRSRGGLVAGLAMWFFLLVGIPSLRKNLLRNFFLFMLIFSTLFLIINYEGMFGNASRFSTRLAEHSLSTRLDWWQRAAHLYFEKTAGAGLGIGGLKYYFNPFSIPHAHNIHLSFLFDIGIIGFAAYIFFILYLAKNLYLTLRQSQGTYMQFMLWACGGGLVAILTHGLVDGEYNLSILWFFFGLTMATLRLAKQELKTGHLNIKGIP